MSVNVQVPTNEQEALRLQLKRLPKAALWAFAARLKTLGLSVTPVIAGTAIAAYSGHWNPLLAFTAAISAACIQIGTNLWNDAADAERGIDTQERLGPPRMTALGLLKAKDVRTGALIAFALAALCGLGSCSISRLADHRHRTCLAGAGLSLFDGPVSLVGNAARRSAGDRIFRDGCSQRDSMESRGAGHVNHFADGASDRSSGGSCSVAQQSS